MIVWIITGVVAVVFLVVCGIIWIALLNAPGTDERENK